MHSQAAQPEGGRGRDGYDFTGNLGDMVCHFVTTGGTGGGSTPPL